MLVSGSSNNNLSDSPDARPPVAPSARATGSTGKANTLDRWVAGKILVGLGGPPFCIQLWDGTRIQRLDVVSHHVVFNDRAALYLVAAEPAYYFGELYSTGRLVVKGDLLDFLDHASLGVGVPRGRLHGVLHMLRHRPKFNSLSGSRQNIHHHYNIGNPFYELWLDEAAMQYTCAYFPDSGMTLEQAQIAKLHHVARKLQLQPGQLVVEAGSGWGGLARFFAQHYGVRVRAYNISHEQVRYATDKAREMGLDERVEFIEDDYRNITETCDVFVSVGMLEHVGRKNYHTLGQVVDRCLHEDGLGLIHSIGRNRPGPMNAWIEKRIFPGAYPPSLKEIMDIFESSELSVLDVENLRLHYARTLEHWLAGYEANIDKVRDMFDENFERAWRLYLAGSRAAFNVGHLQLFQVLFSRERNNTIPRSRAHVYAPD